MVAGRVDGGVGASRTETLGGRPESEPIPSGGEGMIVGAIKGSTRIGYRPPRGVDASLMRRAGYLDSFHAGKRSEPRRLF
jgi:hypothetical protein